MNTLQTTNGSLPANRQTIQSPIAMLPNELQKSVRWFCGFYFETLKGTAAISHRFRWWMEKEGLTLAEAKDAMQALMSPEKSAEIDTAPKVVAMLSVEVAKILRNRREKERSARITGNGEHPNAAEVERLKEMLSRRMTAPEAP